MFSRLNLSTLAGPILVLMVLTLFILPLPPFLLDLFFTFNIAIAIIVLMVAINTRQPLDFSIFPVVLLMTTLLRLALNVASTRVILTNGQQGEAAAGKVIEAFGHFLIGGNIAVGIVVFVILTIINFVVITKGAGRIAEVSARFTLDAMPGKQMAIDADLNAGLIGEDVAKQRRKTITQEADFFGSMDGASKFVRGDAVAGILIIVINLLAGMVVGMLSHDMSFVLAGKTYTLLSIGDGLVAQIPALIISTAAGLVVSRVGDEKDMSEQLLGQLFSRPSTLYITASVIGVFGLIPDMPHIAFLIMAAGLAGLAYYLEQQAKKQEQEPSQAPAELEAAQKAQEQKAQEVGWHDVAQVDPVGLEVGYRIIPLVDRNQDGELLRRIRGIRKKIAQESGFLVPPIHIRDNLELKPNSYRIQLKGVDIGEGEAYPGQFLAINPGRVSGSLPGAATVDPTFGLPAVWVDSYTREQAQALGYTVVDASTVVATHISNLLQTHASELLGREEVQQLLDHLAKEFPKLVEDIVPKMVPLNTLQKVLQGLLDEGMHIRDMRTIMETLAEHISRVQDPDELGNAVRVALGRAIVHQLFPGEQELQVLALDPSLEHVLLQAARGGGLEPGLADTLLAQAAQLSEQMEGQGLATVLIVPSPLRNLLSRFLRRAIPQFRVLAHAEIPESKSIRIVGVLGSVNAEATL